METSDGFVKSKHFNKISKVNHGDTRTNQIGNATQRLGYIPRFVRRIPTCPDSSELSDLFEICLPGTGVGVQSSAIWALPSPMVVHTHSTGGESSAQRNGILMHIYFDDWLLRSQSRRILTTQTLWIQKMCQYFGVEPLSGCCNPGLQVSNPVTQSASITQEISSHL